MTESPKETQSASPRGEMSNGNQAESEVLDVDVLIIGAGFGGCYSLYKFRKQGFTTHVFEAGTSLGGVWHWNSYPGARVDSEIPYYQFSIPEVWKTWSWSQRFPGHDELKRYFAHVDHVLGLTKDVSFENVAVVDAGATAVQCVLNISKSAGKLSVYIRMPNIALPMGQRDLSVLEQNANKAIYKSLFRMARQTPIGLASDPEEHISTEVPEEERRALWEEL